MCEGVYLIQIKVTQVGMRKRGLRTPGYIILIIKQWPLSLQALSAEFYVQ